jgi:CDP-diacylglycerol---serine O-phosphatidyltransferase
MNSPDESAVRPRGIYWLPNLLTTGALFSGFYAIVAAVDGRFDRAGIAVFVASLFDGLDGRVARWTHTESAFGKEYDSLSDMVSFGVAPAIVTYQWGVARVSEYGLLWRRVGWVVCFFYAAAAAMRLARFNSRDAKDKRYFEGLPSPSAAAMVAAFVWVASEYDILGLFGLAIAFAVTALAGALMISKFSYNSFKQHVTDDARIKFAYFAAMVITLILISVDPPRILFILALGYGLSAPLIWCLHRMRRRRSTPVKPV